MGVLTLAGVEAEARGREHTFLSALLAAGWKAGRDLDFAALIQGLQSPPFEKIGVLDVDAFYPSKDRFALATKLNAVLASPGFEQWLEGEPLDPGRLLYGAKGKPRVSIVSIAHLDEAHRMFFVSLLLNEIVAWMRRQSGTSSLRAIVYMDEIAGYFPPVANPPAKAPLLTLLKQGRAFGMGVVLATQNTVDLDYKGLGNTGTWFLGRLADRARQGARARRARGSGGRIARSRGRGQDRSRRWASGCSCCTTSTPGGRSRSRAAGRCRICADRSRASMFGR